MKNKRVCLCLLLVLLVGFLVGFSCRQYFPIQLTYTLITYDIIADKMTYEDVLFRRKIPTPKWKFANSNVHPLVLKKGNLPENREFKLLYCVACTHDNSGSTHTLLLASEAGTDSILVSPNEWSIVASVLGNLPYTPLGCKEPIESIECYDLEIKDMPEALEYIKKVTVAEVR